MQVVQPPSLMNDIAKNEKAVQTDTKQPSTRWRGSVTWGCSNVAVATS